MLVLVLVLNLLLILIPIHPVSYSSISWWHVLTLIYSIQVPLFCCYLVSIEEGLAIVAPTVAFTGPFNSSPSIPPTFESVESVSIYRYLPRMARVLILYCMSHIHSLILFLLMIRMLMILVLVLVLMLTPHCDPDKDFYQRLRFCNHLQRFEY